LSHPQGLFIDHLGNVYVADCWNHRIMRWLKGASEGSIIVGGNAEGKEPNQLNYPEGISFDREGNLYIVSQSSHRGQKFDVAIY
jgi:sugar lactone lactonase YvrE